MKRKNIFASILCVFMLACLATPIMAAGQTRSTNWIYYYFEDIKPNGGIKTVVAPETRSVKQTTSSYGSFKGSTGSWLRPKAQLVNSNEDQRSTWTTISSNGVIYNTLLQDAKVGYYYYPRVQSHSSEWNLTGIELNFSSDNLK